LHKAVRPRLVDRVGGMQLPAETPAADHRLSRPSLARLFHPSHYPKRTLWIGSVVGGREQDFDGETLRSRSDQATVHSALGWIRPCSVGGCWRMKPRSRATVSRPSRNSSVCPQGSTCTIRGPGSSLHQGICG